LGCSAIATDRAEYVCLLAVHDNAKSIQSAGLEWWAPRPVGDDLTDAAEAKKFSEMVKEYISDDNHIGMMRSK
jgi:hypothetical protein